METKISKNDIDAYFKTVKTLLPINSKEEKLFIENLRRNVAEFLSENPDSTYPEMIGRFGEPAEAASEYLQGADIEYLTKRISSARLIRRCAFIALAIVMVAAIMFSVFGYVSYQKADNSFVDREEVIVNEKISYYRSDHGGTFGYPCNDSVCK
jgi:hypothetical protein